jgi:3-methyl-2-oxobutanoate hydroxymethyltransferase
LISVIDFKNSKKSGTPISIVTCYDYWSAKIINETGIDAVLVGDSAAMVMHGYKTTINATIEMMIYHVSAVKKGLTDKFLIADLPFLTHKKGNKFLMNSVDVLMKAGAHSVKIEGAGGNLKAIKSVVESGIPVMGHIGLTPQSFNQLGGYRVQGKDDKTAELLIEDAKLLEEAGCYSIVLELIPSALAKTITENISVPTIGIGAGQYTSGQVLVLQDLLGMNKDFKPKFLKFFMDGFNQIKTALDQYDHEVKQNVFPSDKESF